ncbi:MAG TPA: hypothetical protein VGO08_16905 [Burkholderiales bacterium]|jgi:hypothetical protein|nr:hypothetical protein [Burkholderiales bacterium]
MGSGLKGQRLVAVFLLGCLLFNYPVFWLFESRTQVLGIPMVYAYVFFAWALLIALMAIIVQRSSD